MTKGLLKEPEARFEPLHGERPVVVLDEHPGGEFIAMRVSACNEVERERAAVWSTKGGELVWSPEGVTALCWTRDGKEVLLVRESYGPQPDKHEIIVTPL